MEKTLYDAGAVCYGSVYPRMEECIVRRRKQWMGIKQRWREGMKSSIELASTSCSASNFLFCIPMRVNGVIAAGIRQAGRLKCSKLNNVNSKRYACATRYLRFEYMSCRRKLCLIRLYSAAASPNLAGASSDWLAYPKSRPESSSGRTTS